MCWEGERMGEVEVGGCVGGEVKEIETVLGRGIED